MYNCKRRSWARSKSKVPRDQQHTKHKRFLISCSKGHNIKQLACFLVDRFSVQSLNRTKLGLLLGHCHNGENLCMGASHLVGLSNFTVERLVTRGFYDVRCYNNRACCSRVCGVKSRARGVPFGSSRGRRRPIAASIIEGCARVSNPSVDGGC